MKMNPVYIASTATLTAPLYSPEEAIDILYPQDKVCKKVYKIARRLKTYVGTENRAMVIDPTIFPQKRLSSLDHTPKNWGMALFDRVTSEIEPSQIGLVTVAYNASSHLNILPNLACQIALEANLNLEQMPMEFPYYGCAGGILAIREAINYCQVYQKAAFVYVFEQCTWMFNPIYDTKHRNFTAALRTDLLFSDGAVGLLIIPENMRFNFPSPLIKTLDINQGFQVGDMINMEEGIFLVREGIAETMPALTVEQSIKPLLNKYKLNPEDIDEWSIHQGGIPVLEAFKKQEILGLSQSQIQRSKTLFQKYGNLSAASCLYVLDSFFHDRIVKNNMNSYGLVTAFGAGYYLGSLLYQWE